MKHINTEIWGVIIIEPTVFGDDRGFFFESFNANEFEKAIGERINFIQDNQSFSKYGVIRGLHFQKPPAAQAKLVRILQGRVLDVAVDIRRGSPTFGRCVIVELSAENKRQLFIPKGFAHGFSVLSEEGATMFYKCDYPYSPQDDAGIRYDDTTLAIDWGIPTENAIVSEKDKKLGSFEETRDIFTYSGVV